MNVRGILALALLLVAACFERVAFFGSRSVLSLHLLEQGETHVAIGTTYTLLQALMVVGTLAGGVVALGLGPRITATGGLFVAAAGQFAAAAGAPLAACAGAISFGSGMFRPCLYAAAAEVLAWDDESPAPPGPYRFTAVSAFIVSVYAALNVGGGVGPVLGSALRRFGWGAHYAVAGVETLLGAALAGVAVIVGLLGKNAGRSPGDAGPYRAAPPPGPLPPPVPAALGGLLILLAVEAVYSVGASASSPPTELYRGVSGEWIYMVNPVAVVLASFVVFAVLLVAVVQRLSAPPLYLYGAGLVVFAVGLLIIALAGSTSAVIYALGAVVTGFGEAAAYAVPLAYAAIVVRGRAATLVVAGFTAVVLLVTTAGHALANVEVLRTVLLVGCALLTLGAGGAILALAPRMHRSFFDPQAPG